MTQRNSMPPHDTGEQAPRPARPRDDARPQAPRSRGQQGASEVQSPLDALQSVAFADGDPDIAPAARLGEGRHRSQPLGIAVQGAKALVVCLGIAVAAVIGVMLEGNVGKAVVAAASVALAFLVAVGAAALEWYFSTWELEADGLVLRSGVFVRKQRRIPYQRVHSVDLAASVVERVLGLASLKVDTGAGEVGEGNAVKYLKRADAEALKRELFARRVVVSKQEGVRGDAAESENGLATDAAQASCAPARPAADAQADPAADVDFELQLENRLHVIASLTEFNMSAALVAIVVAFAGIMQFADLFFGTYIANFATQMIQSAIDAGGWQMPRIDVVAFLPAALAMAALFLVVFLVATWVISVVLAYVRWGGFVVRRRGERIEVTCGLLSRSTRAVELNRVQSVSVDQSPLRRARGYVQIAVRTVGSAGSGSSASDRERVVLHPCMPRAQAPAFLAEVLPEFADVVSVPAADLELHALPGAALRRTVLRGVYWTALFAVPLGVFTWYAGQVGAVSQEMAGLVSMLIALAWAVLALVCAFMFVVRVLAWRIRRIGLHGGYLVAVSGGIGRHVTYVARAKIQSLTRRRTPFQAHAGVASVAVRTACVSADGDPRMRDVDAGQVVGFMEWVRPHYDNADQARAALGEAGLL